MSDRSVQKPDVPGRVTIFDTEVATPSYKLFKVAGIGWATLVGSPICGGFLLYQNSRRLGRAELAKRQFLISVLATLGLGLVGIAIALIKSDAVGIVIVRSLGVVAILAVIVYARRSQKSDVFTHRSKGGAVESNWMALGLGFLVSAGVLSILAGLVFGLLATGIGIPRFHKRTVCCIDSHYSKS